MNFIKVLFFILLLGVQAPAFAKLVQIIHTNDLHSFFSGTRSGLGGYSRLKTLITQLKNDAESKNIKTLILDGGDFGEGSSYFFSDRGVDSMRALDLLGVDVTVLGNHDYILGEKELRRQLIASDLKAKILSANLRGKPLMGLSRRVPSYVDYDIDGLKLRIFGLSTNEIHYQYPLRPMGYIGSSHNEGIRMAEKSQRDGVDYLIGLTHVGLDRDMKLISHSRSIDLIIGGHSHTRLDQPKMTQNLKGEIIPILQAGAHGIAVGSLIVDIHGKGEYTLVDYKLYDVTRDIAEDETVQKFVEKAQVNREKYFNRSWEEVIGFSEIVLTGHYNGRIRNAKSCWSKHIARVTRKVAKADLGMQFDIFQGEEVLPGVVRYGDLIDNFPHFRKWGDQGWNVARATVSGFLLKKVIKLLGEADKPFDITFDGLQAWDSQKNKLTSFLLDGKHTTEMARIEGEEINSLKFYTIGLPSEVPYGFGETSFALRELLFNNLKYIKNSNYWQLLESYIKENSPLKCLDN